MLSITRLAKTYGQNSILNNISLTVKRGEIALFLGASGVGKSTLLRILNNLEKFESGLVALDHIPLDISKINQTHTIGMVFQQYNLFEHLTVLENITLGLCYSLKKTDDQARSIALSLLEKYDLGDKKDCYIHQLSGGQKQRIAIIRAIALKPQVICFDEPTSALDPSFTRHVANTIHQLAQERYMVLIATHDVRLVQILDCTVYLMSKGSIVETGFSKLIFNSPDQYPMISQFIKGSTDNGNVNF